ncbi:DUF2975 domain-containing protein [Modestobacter altitudinis]|uniref:DUF2975 domain-containing protein n=1 Tax=Modestobacter altitudinis TaxID=2213158 RepID=UPI0014876002|nr:DUF2975 domain-containing protein [Modestobacter altitudinis]
MSRREAYVRPATIRSLSWFVGLVGVVAAVAGPVYAVNGATQAGAAVEVPVELAGVGDSGALDRVPLAVPDLPQGAAVAAQNQGDGLALSAWDSTIAEQLLARGDAVVLGLAVGVGAWLLRSVLTSVAAGRAFGTDNARRLNGLAVVVVVAGGIGPLLPQIGSLVVLDRLDLVGAGSPFVMGLTFGFPPVLLTGLLLVVLAEAFRQGERLSQDVEGLV